jgi:hypothetical protein
MSRAAFQTAQEQRRKLRREQLAAQRAPRRAEADAAREHIEATRLALQAAAAAESTQLRATARTVAAECVQWKQALLASDDKKAVVEEYLADSAARKAALRDAVKHRARQRRMLVERSRSVGRPDDGMEQEADGQECDDDEDEGDDEEQGGGESGAPPPSRLPPAALDHVDSCACGSANVVNGGVDGSSWAVGASSSTSASPSPSATSTCLFTSALTSKSAMASLRLPPLGLPSRSAPPAPQPNRC